MLKNSRCDGHFYVPGAQLGTVIQLVVSGFIANSWGWPAIFYVNGATGAIWVVAYVFLGSDSPQRSKMIGNTERLYIQTSLGQVGEQKVRYVNYNHDNQIYSKSIYRPSIAKIIIALLVLRTYLFYRT